MAAKRVDMQRLLEQRDSLLKEIVALQNRVKGLEMAIALIEAEDNSHGKKRGSQKSEKKSVKAVLLDLLEEVGTSGLNSPTAVEIAGRRGRTLDAGTVSSLLSRLKKDEVVVFDGSVYRLKKYANLTTKLSESELPLH